MCVGYRDKCATLSTPKNKEKLNLDFIHGLPEEMYNKYRWIFPTVQMVNTATLRYDVEPDFNVILEEIGPTFQLLLQYFGPLINNCDILEPHEVKINKRSASGPNYDYTKLKFGDLLKQHWEEFVECWHFAHERDDPMYWKAAGKTEMLPVEKVDTENARTFMFPDGPHRFTGQMMTQDFNRQMGELKNHWSKIGFDRTHGGFTKLADDLTKRFKTFWEGDLTKWDSRMRRILLAICMFLRWCCYKPGYRTKDNWARLVYQYKNKAKSLMFLPTGQLILIPHGNKSGQDSTSYDNTIAHLFIYLGEVRKRLIEMEREPTLENILEVIEADLYGDDSVGGMSDELRDHLLTKFESIPAWLEQMYGRWGMLFKTKECKVQNTLEGLKFIGGIFKKTPYGWAHTFSVKRAMAAMARDVDNLSPDAQWGKWTSILALMAFEPERHYIRKFMQRQAKVLSLTTADIPSDHDLYTFWFGWERPYKPFAFSMEAVDSKYR